MCVFVDAGRGVAAGGGGFPNGGGFTGGLRNRFSPARRAETSKRSSYPAFIQSNHLNRNNRRPEATTFHEMPPPPPPREINPEPFTANFLTWGKPVNAIDEMTHVLRSVNLQSDYDAFSSAEMKMNDWDVELLVHAGRGDLKGVEHLLSFGANINGRNVVRILFEIFKL